MERSKQRRRIRLSNQPVTRRARSARSAQPQRTPEPIANGFLNHSFQAVAAENQDGLTNRGSTENSFFASVDYFTQLHGLTLDESKISDTYPLNIHQTYQQLVNLLHKKRHDMTLVIVQDEVTPPTLATYVRHEMGMTIYFIPLRPVWDLIEAKACPAATNVLLSIFHYLNRVVNVPGFKEGSYVHYEMEAIADNYDQDWQDHVAGSESEDDSPDYDYGKDIAEQFRLGDAMHTLIDLPDNLTQLISRIESFTPASKAEEQLKEVADRVVSLYQQYPERTIWDNLLRYNIDPTEEESDEYEIGHDHYLSFVWNFNDYILESVIESINHNLQNSCEFDEPTAFQLFNQPHTEVYDTLPFESLLFPLLCDLVDSINDLTTDYEKRKQQL